MSALTTALLVTGCGGADHGAYVRQNEAILASLPVFPGAVKAHELSTPEYSNGEFSDPTGYTTTLVYRVPHGTRGAAVVRFYEHRLERRGWARGSRIRKPWLVEFTRGRALVVLNTITVRPRSGRHARFYEVATDHRGAPQG